jgi:hypothetical protein
MRFFFKLIFIFSCIVSFGQTSDSIKPVVRKFTFLHSPFGYVWQGTHNFDIGIQPSFKLNANNNHDNIGLVIAANLTYVDKATYITPTMRLKFLKEIKKDKLGWEISAGYFYTQFLKKFDHRITPEIGIVIYGFHLTYGYNFPLTNYTDKHTNSNRVALRYTGW